MEIEAVGCGDDDVEQDPRTEESSPQRRPSTRHPTTSWLRAHIILLSAVMIMVGMAASSSGKGRVIKEPNTNKGGRLLPNPKQSTRRHLSFPVSGVFGPKKLSADMSNPRALNVHVVPHTHDDVGWLKTVEQYYHGLNNTIQGVCVKDIWDTVVAALLQNDARTFTYVETKFFSMWWNEQTDEMKDTVRVLIANQQLSFTNGGWCMHGKETR